MGLSDYFPPLRTLVGSGGGGGRGGVGGGRDSVKEVAIMEDKKNK